MAAGLDRLLRVRERGAIVECEAEMISVTRMQSIVAEYYDISREALLGNRRKIRTVTARHMAMFLARVSLDMSYPEIGQAFKRDHSGVIHAVRKMSRLIRDDETMRADMESIRNRMDTVNEIPVPRLMLTDLDRQAIITEVIAEISRRFLREAA